MPTIYYTILDDPWGLGVLCMFIAAGAMLLQCAVLALIEKRRDRHMNTVKPRAAWRGIGWDEE